MAGIIGSLGGVNSITLLVFIVVIVLLVHIVGYVADPHGIRSIPGPFLAKFSDIWLGVVSGHGHRSEVVHEMHKKYGLLQANTYCCLQLTHTPRHLCPPGS
jgi:benzoate 4-monooxygenase